MGTEGCSKPRPWRRGTKARGCCAGGRQVREWRRLRLGGLPPLGELVASAGGPRAAGQAKGGQLVRLRRCLRLV